MRLKPFYKDRYPGLIPFDKGQSTIFFGRDQEKKELFYQICLEKMVVLFSKSGLGKSSLLNAGISPMLEANGYIPVRVRFSSQTDNEKESENLLLRDFRLLLRDAQYKHHIQYNTESPRLWEYVKAVPFNEFIPNDVIPEQNQGNAEKITFTGKRSLNTLTSEAVPVFIFDQFEEFFHHPVQHQQEFLSQLAEIVHQETPYRILDWITDIDPEERTAQQVKWSEQPAIKVIFSLRSDSLANMQSLVSFIPTVLRNRYELKPLDPEQAAQAIKGPAEKELGPEYIPAFSFDQQTLSEIIQELKGKTNEIESSQLQIVCNFIEDKIRKPNTANAEKTLIVVDNSVINPVKDFPVILDNFYESQLNKIEEPVNREIARKLIEDDLVIDGIRDSISKNKLISKYEVSEDLIEEIQNTRLIRQETTSWGSIYELSHDTLIAPVEKSKNRRLLEEGKKKEEAEKQVLAEEAKKNMEELMEKRAQLAKEMKLRKKINKMAAGMSFLIVLVFILFSRNNTSKLTKKAKELDTAYTNLLIQKLENIIGNSKNPEVSDSAKIKMLSLFESADSLSGIYTDKDTAIGNIINEVFEKELQTEVPNSQKLTTREKIKELKRIVPYNKELNKHHIYDTTRFKVNKH